MLLICNVGNQIEPVRELITKAFEPTKKVACVALVSELDKQVVPGDMLFQFSYNGKKAVVFGGCFVKYWAIDYLGFGCQILQWPFFATIRKNARTNNFLMLGADNYVGFEVGELFVKM
jgi:hypothetical protein